MKIVIIGYSGSGKSTLCRLYSKIFFDERIIQGLSPFCIFLYTLVTDLFFRQLTA